MPAAQSSYLRNEFLTAYGNDGDVNTYFHTGRRDVAPWWRVDLGSVYCVESVNLTNRNDHISESGRVLLHIFPQHIR